MSETIFDNFDFRFNGGRGIRLDQLAGLTVASALPSAADATVDDMIIVDDGAAAGIYLARPAANNGKFAGTIGTSEVAANSLQLHFTSNPNGALRLLQWTSDGSQIFFLVNRANITADPGTLYLQIEEADGAALSNRNRNQSRFTAYRATEYDTSTDWAYYVTVDGSTQTRWAALSQNQTATIGIYSDSGYSTEWIAALNKHWQRIAADAGEFAAIKTEVERLERELSPEWADPPTQDQIDAGWAFATNPATSGTPGTASPLDAAYITGTYTAPEAIQTRMFLRTPNDVDPGSARIQLQDNLTAYYPLGNYGWTKITAPSDGDETAYDYYILESNGESTQFGMISGDTMTLQTLQDFVALYGRVNMAEQGLAALRTALTALQSQANDNTTSIQTNTNNIGNRLTQSQVDARIISTARAGNTARWPKNKLPDDIVYDADANAGFLERVVTLTGVVTQPAVDQNGVLFNSNATTRRTVTFQTDSINYPDGYRVAIRASNTGEVVVNQTVSSTTSHLFTLQRDQIVILIKEPGQNNFIELDNSEEIDQKARDAIERLQDLTHDIHAGPGVPDDWRQANALVAEIANRETVWNLNDARAQAAYSLFASSSGDQGPKYVLIKLDHSADIRRFRLELTSLNDDSASPTHIQLTELDVVGNSLPVNGVIQFKYYTDFGAPVVPHGFIAALQQAYGTNETGQSTYSGILDGAARVEEYPSLAGLVVQISQDDYDALDDATKNSGKFFSIFDPDAPSAAPGRPAFLRQESAGANEITYYFGPSNTGGRVQFYEWRHALRSANFSGNWTRIAAHSGEFTARSLTAGTQYKAQLRAGNSAGNSAAITGNGATLAS